MVRTQDFVFSIFAVAIIRVECAVTTAAMAAKFLFACFSFSVTGQFTACAARAYMGLSYHAPYFTHNSHDSTTTDSFMMTLSLFGVISNSFTFIANLLEIAIF